MNLNDYIQVEGEDPRYRNLENMVSYDVEIDPQNRYVDSMVNKEVIRRANMKGLMDVLYKAELETLTQAPKVNLINDYITNPAVGRVGNVVKPLETYMAPGGKFYGRMDNIPPFNPNLANVGPAVAAVGPAVAPLAAGIPGPAAPILGGPGHPLVPGGIAPAATMADNFRYLVNKIITEAQSGVINTYSNLSPDQRNLVLGIVANTLIYDFLLNPNSIPRGLFEAGNELLFKLGKDTSEAIGELGGELYNTGLKAYENIKNMPFNILYNWFESRPRVMSGGKYSGVDGGEEYFYTEKDLEDLEKVLRQEKIIETPLKAEIKEALKEVEKVKEDIKYGGTAYEGEEKRKYYESAEYKNLRDKLSKLYKDVTSYREGPITRSGYLEPTGALTSEINSQVPFGMNINQRLTPAEMKELRRRQKLKSKTIKEFYGEAPELNQSIEPAVTHNNNPTQGPIFDIPDSSPRQMQAAVLNPQDIINQMRAGKQKKSKKVKQTSILGVERSTKESTKAQTSRRV